MFAVLVVLLLRGGPGLQLFLDGEEKAKFVFARNEQAEVAERPCGDGQRRQGGEERSRPRLILEVFDARLAQRSERGRSRRLVARRPEEFPLPLPGANAGRPEKNNSREDQDGNNRKSK